MRAKTLKQKTVRIITSASFFTDWNNAPTMVFRPARYSRSQLKGVGNMKGRHVQIIQREPESFRDSLFYSMHSFSFDYVTQNATLDSSVIDIGF